MAIIYASAPLAAMSYPASLARTARALYIIEDAQWIDGVSESMLADFITFIPHTTSLVLNHLPPEYRGARLGAEATPTLAETTQHSSSALLVSAGNRGISSLVWTTQSR